MGVTLFDQIRDQCADVARRAHHVAIDDGRLGEYAATIPIGPATHPTLAPGERPTGDRAALVAWVLTVNAVNFGSGFFPLLRKRPGLSGSATVFAGLRDHFEHAGAMTATQLVEATPAGCAQIFGQDLTGPIAQLMGWFADAWRELGHAVLSRWDGSFDAMIEEAGGRAEHLAATLGDLPMWHDVSCHDGVAVPLFKRAQLVPAHLSMMFDGMGPGRFDDLSKLTIFADNLVPHVLRVDGVLRYQPALAQRIDEGRLLVAGSAEEVEIRAVAVHAVERLGDQLRAAGHPVTSMGLDQVLWARGGGARYKAVARHRARTTFY